jgi:glycosyltransferase involved in cell wall biosynthesis
MRIAVIHSNADYLLGSRLPLLLHLRRRFDVVALAPRLSEGHRVELAGHGIRAASISLNPTGLNPLADTIDTFRLARQLRRLKPDAVVTNTLKPVTLGTFASVLAGVPRRYALISGLGFAFIEDEGPPDLRRRIIRTIARLEYRLALPRNLRVAFHNLDDLREFVEAGICPADRVGHVDGSGVDTRAYELAPPTAVPAFICVSRLLGDKGVREYMEAARIVKARIPEATFLLVGDVDQNPMAIDPAEVDRYVQAGVLDWPGHVRDVRPLLRRAGVFVMPSYREGLPRSTLEAMAIGRAVVTTDVPGCRETVVEGENGLLVPARDVPALAAAMEELARDPDRVAAMGRASRRMAEEKFDIEVVHRQLDEVMGW